MSQNEPTVREGTWDELGILPGRLMKMVCESKAIIIGRRWEARGTKKPYIYRLVEQPPKRG